MSSEREFSAGGVVVRGADCVVIVPHKRSQQGERVLGLPKGHPDGEESAEQAAAREVRFFLFRYVSGNTDDHDHEIEHARWMPLADAAVELTYAGEREMAARALS